MFPYNNGKVARSNRSNLGLICSVFALAAGSQPALAQDASAEKSSASSDNAIVVTALRRDTTLQETPIAITALSGETLKDAGVTNITEYVKFVPSLNVQDNGPGSRRVSLRGVQASGEPTVGIYYDDTPVTGSVGVSSDAAGRTADFTLFDVERVEVLRGPQGTLYGSSSMGGAIRVILNKPTNEYEGAVEASVSDVKGGGFGYFVNGMVNVPLVDDTLAARAVLYRRESDGWIDNTFLDRENVNDYTATGGRLMLRYTPTSNFTFDLSAMFENTDAFSYSFNPDLGEYNSATQVMLPYNDKSQIYNGTVNWDLGGANLTGIVSYQHRESAYAADDSYYIASYLTPGRCASFVNGSSTTPCSDDQLSNYYDYVNSLIPAAIYYPGNTKDFSSELRLSSDGSGPFEWTVGGFYENRKNYVESEDARADKETGDIIKPVELFYRRLIWDKLEQFAAYAEGTFHPTETLGLTVGARYYDYSKTVTGTTDMPWELIGATARPLATVDSSENGILLKFNASWQPNRATNIYATASQGFRPGGANQVIGLPDELTPYESDSLWNYELGGKFEFLDGALTTNVAAYQIDWDNIQVRGRTPNGAFSFLSNAGAARIRGAELEVSARPVQGLNLRVSGSYLDAKLTEDQISDVVNAAGREGDRIPYIPHWTASASADYTVPVSSSTDFTTRADFNYVGSSYSEFRPTSAYYLQIPEYALVNMRAGLEFGEGSTGLYLFVNNLFDAFAINRASTGSTQNAYSATAAAPRTIGLNLRHNF